MTSIKLPLEKLKSHIRALWRKSESFVLDGRNIALVIFLILAVSLTYGIFKSSDKNQRLKADIERLKTENDITELENENIRLGAKYFTSRTYIELEARRRLNKALPGETVLILPKR
jgi:cell division protein FtsB